MIIHDDFSVEYADHRKEIASALQGLTFSQTVALWKELDEAFRKDGLTQDLYRNLCLTDRFFLLTKILGRDDAMREWIFDRCREVEAAKSGYLDLWAREHFKSSVITHAGSIQEILNNREITIGIFSHTKGIARKFLRQIKHDLESKASLKRLFPDVLYQNPSRESPRWTVDSGIIVRRDGNPKEATVEAWGVVDGQPTGAHFKLRIYDDLVTAESVSTPEQISKTTEMLALSDNLGSEGGDVWFIGTRYSFGDTYQQMIERGQVKTRIYTATDDGTLGGKPVLFSEKYWEDKKRSQTISTLSCQMLQNPLAGSQAMFNPMDFRGYSTHPETLNIYIMVDPASSVKKGSDKTAMVVVGVDANMNKFLLDGFHHKMGLTEKWENMRHLYGKWRGKTGVQGVFVGYEKFGMQSDIEHFKIQMERESYFFEIQELAWPRQGNASKIDRISRLEPDFRKGKFFLPTLTYEDGKIYAWRFREDDRGRPYFDRVHLTRDKIQKSKALSHPLAAKPIVRKNEEKRIYDLTDDFIKQAMTLPFSGGHDDLVDALSRIYDMDIRPPVIYSKASTLPHVFNDGI